ncbi:M20 family metallo-hydrolase [Bacillus sp. FJAT-49711]|uniref:M20 family metallo-hydrolase n=1 Tax=Bacillus sp. FJAT-49711 TaxID=2833585 RepID=UPI001BCA0A1C|nr:M20 family metallo-hydrolase [Bacillus sp. FJAT-49711]MBS4220206.1 M20 family metallo-hydrolase [Bacillus sp. FJAT-49711]
MDYLHEKLIADYDKSLDYKGVRGSRLASRLFALSQIGPTEKGGSNRIGFSEEEKEAKNMIIKWMEEAGLIVSLDGAGNVIGRLTGKNPNQPAIVSGSHVDSVPNGGHFDGPLGVLAALEVVEAWKETVYIPERPFEVIVFTDEEGTRFNGGLTGSMSIVGEIKKEDLLKQVDIYGVSFEEVLDNIGLSIDSLLSAKRDFSKIEAFVEVHIEQGKRLEKAGIPVGIVTGIAGPCWLEMTFTGSAGHAGNTPMDDRKDSLVAASQFIAELPSLPQQVSSSAVATVGKLHVHPNGVNVIPGQVKLTVDIRDIHESSRNELVNLITEKASTICMNNHIELEWKETLRVDPVPIKKEMQKKLEKAMRANHIEPFYLPSGAGHDAMIIGRHLPAAMIFVQSKDGISHNPLEWSSLNDCIQAVHVLKHFVESY